jgi:dTDP-4-dehydrorhamnose reductase
MKVLVTGINGQLGHDVMNELKKRGHEAVGTGSAEMDITDAAAVRSVLNREKPDAVIHCAAYTAVDKAEDNEELCRMVNAEGTKNIAEECRRLGAKMLYLSTEYVFSGDGTRPWEPEDKAQPLNIYGQTKYEGEIAVAECLENYFIVRISWAFGINGSNFIKTMLRLGKENGAVSVVDDQIGSPTYTYDLSVLLVDMIESDKYGIYHASNEGTCSWYEFAVEIFKQAHCSVAVTPVDSSAFQTKAKRPKNSRMSKEKLTANGFSLLPSWQDALHRYINCELRISTDSDKLE